MNANQQLIADLIAQGSAIQPKISRDEIERQAEAATARLQQLIGPMQAQAAAVSAKARELALAMDDQIAAASSTPSPTQEFLAFLTPDLFKETNEHGNQ